jgi:hypothetical protein
VCIKSLTGNAVLTAEDLAPVLQEMETMVSLYTEPSQVVGICMQHQVRLSVYSTQ